MTELLEYLSKAATVIVMLIIGLFALLIILAWPILEALAPWVIYSTVGIAGLAGLAWLVAFVLRQWFVTRGVAAKSRTYRIEAAAAAALAQAEAEAKARKLWAEARKAERDADLHVITAPDNHQVFISDTNHAAKFTAAHLALSGRVNGQPVEPKAIEAAAWERWHSVRTSQTSPALGPGQNTAAMLPDKIDLLSLLPIEGPSINKVMLGVTTGPSGIEPVSAALASMVHVGIGGSSGWGKSVFLQALAFQLAMSPEIVELAMVDIEAVTFAPFAQLGRERLRYPVADEETDILAIFQDLNGELSRRKELYRAHPEADSLVSYNQAAGEQLPPVALMIDESTMLLDDTRMTAALLPLALRARKYGIYCLLGGQNWTAASVPSKLRDQFSTRIQFKALSKSQSRVMIEDSAAAEIDAPGRAWAVLRGRDMLEMQTPFIDQRTLAGALKSLASDNRPIMPAADDDQADQAERIRELHAAGLNKTEIARELGYTSNSGSIFYVIRDALEGTTTGSS